MFDTTNAIFVAYTMALGNFDQLEICWLYNAITGFGKIDKENLSYDKALRHDLIRRDGVPIAPEQFERALRYMVDRRL